MPSEITQEASLIGTICEQGPAGKDGKDGKTPVRGVDYWTEADKTEIVEEAMPHPDWNENDPTSKNYVKNRPGGYTINSKTIKWDGNSEGKPSIEHDDVGPYTNIKLVKVSDVVLSTKECLIGETIEIKTLKKNPDIIISDPKVTIVEDNLIVDKIGTTTILEYVKPFGDDVIVSIASFSAPIADTNVEESGTYFFIGDALNETFYVSSLSISEMLIKIPLDLIDTSEVAEVLNNFASSLDNIETAANKAQTAANKAQTTADDAKTQAKSAIETANAASSSIDNKADAGQVESLQNEFDQFRTEISDTIDSKYDDLGLRIDNISAEVTEVQSTANSALQRANTLTDDYINNLIDTKLGVIENGTY